MKLKSLKKVRRQLGYRDVDPNRQYLEERVSDSLNSAAKYAGSTGNPDLVEAAVALATFLQQVNQRTYPVTDRLIAPGPEQLLKVALENLPASPPSA